MSVPSNEKKCKKYQQLVSNIQNNFSAALYDAEKIAETLMCTNSISTIEDVLKFYNNQRDSNSAVIKQKPISELEQWEVSDENISHSSKNFFEVIGISTRESSSREVGKKGWDQPIIKEKNDVGGLLGLIRTYINDMPHYLVDAKFEPGNFQDIQFSPTLQATFSNIEMAHGGSSPNYIEFFKDYKNKENYIFNNWLSEDGGRLYKKRNLGLIKSVNFEKIGPLKSSFIYLSRHQILALSKNETIINPHLMRLINF
jgi:oxidase EvaA